MNDTDRRAIAALQAGLSDSPTPWADAASALGVSETDLLRRLRAMKKAGVLRGVRAVLDPRALGLKGGALVAWRAGKTRANDVGRLFARRPEVTHCVLRKRAPEWPYDFYTMVHAPTPRRCLEVVREMAKASRLTDYVVLETTRELKKSAPKYF